MSLLFQMEFVYVSLYVIYFKYNGNDIMKDIQLFWGEFGADVLPDMKIIVKIPLLFETGGQG